MDGLEDIIKEFLVESYESLDRLDGDLLALENAPGDPDRLASIFRTVHTIKGTSGFLALPKLERVTHVGENLLVPLRDGELELNHHIANALLEMVDAIRYILGKLESEGTEGEEDYDALVAKLQAVLANDPSVTAQNSAIETSPSPPSESVAESEESPASSARISQQLNAKEISDRTKSVTGDRTQPVVDSTVRIDVCLLDKLMNLVGELVLARNQIIQFSSASDDAAMIAASQRLNLITTELQEGVMKTRMQPIRNAWSKLPRVVRDLASSCGKKVEVQMEGADTELDKTILEAIKDPLTHIVRNSVDHGIESSDVRIQIGKPAEGVLCLRAFHEGGQVNIEIIDDGGGIDAERVREKAIEKGIVSTTQADEMSERELTSLILLPGFSTAPKVTNVSGRGVGMDVVKTNIERIGGTLEINSTAGKGTTLRIKIPLTLAIVPALIVKTEGDQYAIPQVSLLELVRLDGERAQNDIEFIHDIPVYRLRENLLPLVYLDEQLELRAPRKRHDEQQNVNIVVLQAEDRQFGLVVDAITDTQEIVVKPLGPHFKGIGVYAGATIMGDGAVSLILDVIGLAQKASVLTQHRTRSLREGHQCENARSKDVETLLIVDAGDGTRAAIHLSSVDRLEEFNVSDVEVSGQSQVVQYRDQILPLISINGGFGSLESMTQEDSQQLQTVVYTEGNHSVGVVVGKIVDIVHQLDRPEGEASAQRSVIQGRVTEMVDLPSIVQSAMPVQANQWASL